TRKKEINTIGTLNVYSFIIRRPVDTALDLHRLVHLATRNWLRKEEQLSQSIEKAIMRLEEDFPNDICCPTSSARPPSRETITLLPCCEVWCTCLSTSSHRSSRIYGRSTITQI